MFGVVALIYLTYALWAFLVARDVVRIRREVSTPVSLLWILVALFVPFGIVAWVIYRRVLRQREISHQA
jgi:hypothetical protein